MAGVADGRLVADILAIFLRNLIKQKAIAAATTVFIGHSAGVHVGWSTALQIPGLRGFIEAFYKNQNIGLICEKNG
uniref:Uncharacterized protein n=1 Tax=Romanomermis culicivorax TaxID=13658 RepID=A0A915HN45_ROMCU